MEVILTPPSGLVSIDSSCRHSRAVLSKARQVVLDLEPGNLVLRPYMIVWTYPLGFIQTSNGDEHSVAEDFFVHRQRASAVGTKSALCVCRRSISRRFAFDPVERSDEEMDEGQSRRAR